MASYATDAMLFFLFRKTVLQSRLQSKGDPGNTILLLTKIMKSSEDFIGDVTK